MNVRLRHVANLVRGAGFPHDYQGLDAGDLPFFKVGDLSREENATFLVACNNWISEGTATMLRAQVVPADTVLLPKIGAALLGGVRRITTRRSVFDNNVLGIVPTSCDPRYLRYWLATLDLAELANPGPVPSLNDAALSDLRIPQGDLSQQRAIADYLDAETARIDALIAKKRRLVEVLGERVALVAYLLTTQSGEHVALRRFVAKIQTGTTPAIDDFAALEGGGESWYSPGDIGDWLRMRDAKRTLDSRAIDEGSVPRFPKESTIIVGIGATAGRVGYLDHDASGNQQLTCIVSSAGLLGRFLAWQLLARRSEIRAIAPYTTLPILNNDFLKSLPIVVPSSCDQQAVVSEIDDLCQRTVRLCRLLAAQISLLIEHRQALITAAVTGEVAVPGIAA